MASVCKTEAGERWRIGDVTITRIIETENGGLEPGMLFSGLGTDQVKQISWLNPYYADADGFLRLSCHAFVLESAGKRIIVDTCVGNDKERLVPDYHHMATPFLERLVEAGFEPESIDYVICTHMHIDHVGWNTRWDGTRWVPTFPNARYLFGRTEWEHFRGEGKLTGDVPELMAAMLEVKTVIADSITPIVDSGLAQFVESDHHVTDEISLVPTPGHTPGHVSVAIESNGSRGIITGDLIHHPVQLTDPAIGAIVDFNVRTAEQTRRTFIRDHADQDVVVLGTHFATPSGGQIVSDDAGWRFKPSGKVGI